MRIFIICLIFLTGCDIETSGYDVNDYDLIDYNTQLRIKIDSDATPELSFFIKQWDEIQICAGISKYPAPFIATVNTIEGPTDGFFYFSDQLIVVEYPVHFLLIRHEMLHYLLYPSDKTHESYLFKKCARNTVIY